ncbi:peptidoglycan/xylan/chitin deacetylase (PgdA/CDA1 family) [Polymorphobacter multimanifer]|uniref:Chitooligosaccharide deacetylase n=1 Tax=Polymorphobacter multimanifer TaxID=1070431 RepID=A0A841L8H3_9SPHN|nr:polysaccharide deacetylase [Polymorphobacter multimanifer]MBB6228854.1 peptidoglycan/xylan/chitin deacetylase (PgdA/CDA1 family) [Polymorphobacter multimanifer]
METPHLQPETEWRSRVERVRAGRSLKPTHWPDGAKAAVALSFDCDHECFELGGGGETIGRLAWGEFGRRVGVPRILEHLGRQGVPASFFMPAVTALLDPDETRRIAGGGHEIGLHGWIHENNSHLDRETERGLMMRAQDVLTGILGRPVRGFRSANWDLSPHTIALVKELGLAYDSSLMADENPYELLIEGVPSGVVEVPVEWIRDDAVYLLFNRNPATRPWTTPDDVFTIFRREIEGAVAEGGLFQLVMHPFVIGYRSRIWMLDAMIEHARSLGPVWFATHEQVADWCLAHASA